MCKTSKADGLPGPSLDEQAQFRATIAAELPALIYFLLYEFEAVFPDILRNDRFGVRSYENPAIRAELQANRPEIQLLDMLDTARPWLKSDKGYWIGKWTELQTLLENDGDVSTDFERWVKFNSLTTHLSKIKSEVDADGPFKDRITYVRHGNGGLWKIFPPPAGTTQNAPPADEL